MLGASETLGSRVLRLMGLGGSSVLSLLAPPFCLGDFIGSHGLKNLDLVNSKFVSSLDLPSDLWTQISGCPL